MKIKWIPRYLFLISLFVIQPFILSRTTGYEDYYGTSGCRLLLCLQNPNGPNAVSECNHDVNAFYEEIVEAIVERRKPDIPIPYCSEALAMDRAKAGMNSKTQNPLPSSNMDASQAFKEFVPDSNKQEVFNGLSEKLSEKDISKKKRKKAKKSLENLWN